MQQRLTPEQPSNLELGRSSLVEALELNQVQQSHGTNGQCESEKGIHGGNSLFRCVSL
jgi:hypothetical protein